MLANSKWGIEARGEAATKIHEGVFRDAALEQVDKEWLDGPSPFDEEGKQTTAQTFQFGTDKRGELTAVDGSWRAALNWTPVHLPAWGHPSPIFRIFHDAGIPEVLAVAKADDRGA